MSEKHYGAAALWMVIGGLGGCWAGDSNSLDLSWGCQNGQTVVTDGSWAYPMNLVLDAGLLNAGCEEQCAQLGAMLLTEQNRLAAGSSSVFIDQNDKASLFCGAGSFPIPDGGELGANGGDCQPICFGILQDAGGSPIASGYTCTPSPTSNWALFDQYGDYTPMSDGGGPALSCNFQTSSICDNSWGD